MKKLLTAATALAAVALTVPGQAAPLSAGACVPVTFGTPCVAASIATTGANLLSVPATAVGAFTVTGSATAGSSTTSAFFNSQTIDVSTTTGGLLDIYFTVNNIPTLGVPLTFTSTFTSNQQNATTHSVIESTFLSNTNATFSTTGVALGSATLTSAVLQTGGPIFTTTTPGANVSFTHLYQIELLGCAGQAAGTCTANLTIDLSAAQVGAAEPAGIAILGLGILGLGFVISRGKRSSNVEYA